MDANVNQPDEVETFQLGSSSLRLHDDGSGLDGRASLIGASVPPHSAGPPMHVHHTLVEIFHVTSGSLRVHVGTEHVDIAEGGTCSVPTGVPHTYSNVSGEPVSFMIVISSDLVPRLFRKLHVLPTDASGQLDAAEVNQLMIEHDTASWGDAPAGATS